MNDSAALPKGVINYHRVAGKVQGSVLAGEIPRAWLNDETPGGPLRGIGQELRARADPLHAHWIFGGAGQPEGQGQVAVPGEAARPLVLQVFNLGRDAAVMTVAPGCGLDSFMHSMLGSALLQVTEMANELFYVIRAEDGYILHASPRLLKLYGLSLEQLRFNPKIWHERLAPGDREVVSQAYQQVRATGSWSGSYQLQASDGQVHSLKDHAVAVPHHQPPLILGFVSDQSTHVSRDALAAAQLAAIDKSYEAFAITDKEGCFTHMNRAHLRMFGFTELSQVLGKPWSILYAPAQVAQISSQVFPAIMQNGYWSGILPARRQDGTLFSEDLTLTLLPHGGVVCNCRDRSAETAMHERIEQSEALLRNFVNHVPVGIVIKDSSGRYVFVNEQFACLWGREPAQFVGRLDSEMMPPEVTRIIREAEVLAVREGRNTRFELNLTHDGRSIELEASKFPVKNAAGELQYIGCVYSDIHQRKQLELQAANLVEHQSELVAMQREFVSMVSHEFRTPLTAIQGAHYLLQKKLGPTPPAPVARYLELESQSITALTRLVDQVLLLNRLEHRNAQPQFAPQPVVARVSTLVEYFNATHITGQPRIMLQTRLPADFSLPLDDSLFRTALENVISNAMKYSPEAKPVAVEVSADADYLCVAVRDEGRGIPENQRERVFQPFFRAANVGQTPGTGLGLAITRKAVEHHLGRVEFDSAPGVGTTFRLYFPLQPRNPSASSAHPHVHPSPHLGRRG